MCCYLFRLFIFDDRLLEQTIPHVLCLLSSLFLLVLFIPYIFSRYSASFGFWFSWVIIIIFFKNIIILIPKRLKLFMSLKNALFVKWWRISIIWRDAWKRRADENNWYDYILKAKQHIFSLSFFSLKLSHLNTYINKWRLHSRNISQAKDQSSPRTFPKEFHIKGRFVCPWGILKQGGIIIERHQQASTN